MGYYWGGLSFEHLEQHDHCLLDPAMFHKIRNTIFHFAGKVRVCYRGLRTRKDRQFPIPSCLEEDSEKGPASIKVPGVEQSRCIAEDIVAGILPAGENVDIESEAIVSLFD